MAKMTIRERLEKKEQQNQKIEQIYAQMSSITGKPVYEDFNWRCGKVLGVLRHVFQNPKKRNELFEITGLNSAYVDLYYEVCGNLPYVQTNTNSLNLGRKMDIAATKEFISVVAEKLGIEITKAELDDFSEEKWERLYQNALESARKTIEFNELNTIEEYEE